MRVLRGLFQRLNGEVQGIQQSTSWVFIQLDQDLTGFIRNLSRLKTKVSLCDPLLGSTEELPPELTRQGKQFITEIGALARQLYDLVQEMHGAIGSFQLGAPEEPGSKANNSTSPSVSGRLPNVPMPQLPNTPIPPTSRFFGEGGKVAQNGRKKT
ncbi:MAG TPA: hypothetical protein VHV10_07460 [Ktedonobacteraceae bacterium]|nr:hypothetical protein [Ktedonobacteraceae bacterium]